MKNVFLSAAIALTALSATNPASAQFAYNLSTLNQAYTPLTNATSLTRQSLWTSDTILSVPVGFNFKIAGTSANTVYLFGGNFIAPSVSAVQSGFIMLGTGLMDRGAIRGISKSDIRYTTTGTAGSRIFKLEVYNAGFEDELFNYGELKDSISMQLWLYEGSNITEFRYGPSMVSNFNDYFGPKMMTGYMRNVDTATATFEKFYVLNGTTANPAIDSFSGTIGNKGLSSMPASGTVYRFTPKGTAAGLGQVTSGTIAKMYPTTCSGKLTIERTAAGSLSYSILSLNGQVLMQGYAFGGRTSIDVSSFAAGTYLVKITDGERIFEVQKMIKL